jgi:hypothetical protein
MFELVVVLALAHYCALLLVQFFLQGLYVLVLLELDSLKMDDALL